MNKPKRRGETVTHLVGEEINKQGTSIASPCKKRKRTDDRSSPGKGEKKHPVLTQSANRGRKFSLTDTTDLGRGGERHRKTPPVGHQSEQLGEMQ